MSKIQIVIAPPGPTTTERVLKLIQNHPEGTTVRELSHQLNRPVSMVQHCHSSLISSGQVYARMSENGMQRVYYPSSTIERSLRIVSEGERHKFDVAVGFANLVGQKLSHIIFCSKHERYLTEELVPPSDAQIIGIKSAKGTGKTQWLTEQVSFALAAGQRSLVATHRIQLAKELCHRFGIDHIEEIRSSQTGGILGYGVCIDSLHPKSQARFNPTDWEKALVILDECEQVIWHLLNSPSTLQEDRFF